MKILATMPPETLSRSDFDARREDGELSLTLVGMSNVGKSFWSSRLAEEAGFNRVAMDDLIEAKLGTVLHDAGYNGGIADVARWMGQPYEPQSPANQQTYLDLETMMMHQTIDRLANPPLGGNVVVDTTGSVVHIDQEVSKEITKHSTVVYLEATPDMRQKMFEKYMREPKPVIWGDVYTQAENESHEQALARSYPELLARRSVLYEQMAHVTIPHKVSLAIASTDEFLDYVRDMLPTAYAYSTSYGRS
jgi:shikimate kinase